MASAPTIAATVAPFVAGPGVGDPDAPIGIFDSGVGGLTVARSVIDQLPDEAILYVGDTARGPYGPRPIAEVRAFALDVMDHLVESGVKIFRREKSRDFRQVVLQKFDRFFL